MIITALAIYFLIGVLLVAFGSAKISISRAVEELRESSQVMELQGRDGIPERKIIAYRVILSIAAILLWPVFLTSFLSEQKEREKENAPEDVEHEELVVAGIRFQSMGGAGVVSCGDCDYSEKIISFTHGWNASTTGYQCKACGKFASRSGVRPFVEDDEYDLSQPLDEIPLRYRDGVINSMQLNLRHIESKMQSASKEGWDESWELDAVRFREALSVVPMEELERIRNIQEKSDADRHAASFCECGSVLSRDHTLFCPKCQSNKLSYHCSYIT
jgi:hypothetical protein